MSTLKSLYNRLYLSSIYSDKLTTEDVAAALLELAENQRQICKMLADSGNQEAEKLERELTFGGNK